MRRKIRVVGAMIEQDGKYLITQRPPRATLPLLSRALGTGDGTATVIVVAPALKATLLATRSPAAAQLPLAL